MKTKPAKTKGTYRRPYRVNPYERKFHDPWGNQRGNHNGIINYQYQVCQAELNSYYEDGSLNKCLWFLDKSRLMEHNHGRFTRTNSRIEKLRR